LFDGLNPGLREQLEEHLGELGVRAYAVAMIRLMGRASNARMARYYRGSWLSEALPGLPLSESSMTAFMRELGSRREAIMGFMRAGLPRGGTLLFDGTRVLCSSTGVAAARYGAGGRRQLNVLTAFEASTSRPVWYRLLPGNIADVSAFRNALEESGMRDCTLIADRGFYSKANVGAMDRAAMRYVMPLKANTRLVDTGFLEDEGSGWADGFFEYHGRVIWHKRIAIGAHGKHVYVYRDSAKRAQMEANAARRIQAGYGDATRERLEAERPRYGMSLLYTNLEDQDAQGVYHAYKSRWQIEECFDYLKNGLDLGVVYQRTDEQAEAWAFLNHLSLTMYYSLYAKLRQTGLPARYTPDSVIAIARTIHRVNINNTWRTSETSKPDQQLYQTLGITLPDL
jgi:hypothetical protein